MDVLQIIIGIVVLIIILFIGTFVFKLALFFAPLVTGIFGGIYIWKLGHDNIAVIFALCLLLCQAFWAEFLIYKKGYFD